MAIQTNRPKVFTYWQIVLGSLLGTIVTGIILMAMNHGSNGNVKRVFTIIFAGICSAIVCWVISFQFLGDVPAFVHFIIQVLVMITIIYLLGEEYDEWITDNTATKRTYVAVFAICGIFYALIFLLSYTLVEN